MIKCIVGLKGHGKTKQLIELVNNAAVDAHGSIICIERTPTLTYDIDHACRLIDTVDYKIEGFDAFYGFLCGLYSQNYDITQVFVDSLYKITGDSDKARSELFFYRLAALSQQTGIDFTLTVSADPDSLPENAKQYII